MATTQSTTAFNPEAVAERVFESILGAMDIFSIHIGDQLGFYRALFEDGSATSTELAERTGTTERYVREWLEQQAVTGFLTVEDADAPALDRRFRLPDGADAVFVDPESLMILTPMAQIFVGCVNPLDQVLDAFRTGAGVPYEDYGDDLAEGQAGTTRPQFRHLLAQEWIPAMPDVLAKMESPAGARVADIGMGLGWSSIALAEAFPSVRVDGFDMDAASVASAKDNAINAGVQDRVTFHQQDAADADLDGMFDFAMAVECIHDMSNPVPVLETMRLLVGNNGPVLVVDERVADVFTAPGDEVERYMYGFSVLHCLPAGMTEQPSAATGTVMREATLRNYAEDAGFSNVTVLPIENDFFRFYRLDT